MSDAAALSFDFLTIQAHRWIQRLRGGAQAHMVECSDGHCYVVKVASNPQGRRILINEWLASAVFTHLGIETPETRLVELSAEFMATNPEFNFQLGTRSVPIEPGIGFGSRLTALNHYDFLPDALLAKVENLSDFLGALVADKWLDNADGRQVSFYRQGR